MKSIGILFPGEMGGALCKLLVEKDFTVFTSPFGRSQKTIQSSIDNGAIIKDTIEDVIFESEIIFSLVPPSAAITIANQCFQIITGTKHRFYYIDCNSVNPSTKQKINKLFYNTGVNFIDGAFIGSSKLIRSKARLILSGPFADQIAQVLKCALIVSDIGNQIGKASELKMCFAGFNKGLVALFLEFSYASLKSSNWRILHQCLQDFYPGTMETIERLLPSYPRHVARRVDEIDELCNYLYSNDQSPAISKGIYLILQALNHSFSKTTTTTMDSKYRTLDDILQHCIQTKFLDIKGEK